MSIDISAKMIEPLRRTYDQVSRRIGDKAASRYQEAVFDVQPTVNFHYRPTWDKDHELYDQRRTAIVMEDWYSFTDPRQFYYGTYTITRSKQQEVAEHNYAFVEKRDLLESVPESTRQSIREVLIPLRHVEWAANMNNVMITEAGYGTTITSATMFHAMDRLGMAQYISRIGLMLDGNETTALDAARQAWLEVPEWQELRHAIEDVLVIKDWFEVMVAQNIIQDGLIFPLLFDRYEARVSRDGASSIAMLTEFMAEWYSESERWTNALIKVTAAESEANAELLTQWAQTWLARYEIALLPVAKLAFGDEGESQLAEVKQLLIKRLAKQGLKL